MFKWSVTVFWDHLSLFPKKKKGIGIRIDKRKSVSATVAEQCKERRQWWQQKEHPQEISSERKGMSTCPEKTYQHSSFCLCLCLFSFLTIVCIDWSPRESFMEKISIFLWLCDRYKQQQRKAKKEKKQEVTRCNNTKKAALYKWSSW